ncbi:hypothetical protein [uncultured Sulfitobacter sp.]|uniref:hypothetical protein n=1 Tax=uncultured Sulfitobacter sp. TaxID=191468 RepID=UPI00261C1CC7|nr:hypothetical protein [uncultured Sulfitobacter sp.]
MTPYKAYIFDELKAVLAKAEPEQIERLLHDIAQGTFLETAQTRAGDNDNQTNVTNMVKHRIEAADCAPTQELSDAARDTRRMRYSS